MIQKQWRRKRGYLDRKVGLEYTASLLPIQARGVVLVVWESAHYLLFYYFALEYCTLGVNLPLWLLESLHYASSRGFGADESFARHLERVPWFPSRGFFARRDTGGNGGSISSLEGQGCAREFLRRPSIPP